MVTTYIASSNTATNGQALGAAGQDVLVHKLIIGLPVASGNIILYNKAVAFSGDTSNIGAKITLPGTITYQNSYPVQLVYDFGEQGLPLDGGNVMIDQTMQVTVVWELADQAN